MFVFGPIFFLFKERSFVLFSSLMCFGWWFQGFIWWELYVVFVASSLSNLWFDKKSLGFWLKLYQFLWTCWLAFGIWQCSFHSPYIGYKNLATNWDFHCLQFQLMNFSAILLHGFCCWNQAEPLAEVFRWLLFNQSVFRTSLFSELYHQIHPNLSNFIHPKGITVFCYISSPPVITKFINYRVSS